MIIRWLPTAAENLDIIYNYYYQLRPSYAKKLYELIIKEINMLVHFPLKAPIEPQLDQPCQQFRSLLINKQFKIIYYIKNETIYIADIWSCHQNPATLSKRITDK